LRLGVETNVPSWTHDTSVNVFDVVRRSIAMTAVACLLAAGCGSGGDARIDLSRLDVGPYSTAVRDIPDQPSLRNGTVLEGIRMSEAVADTSQFGSTLNYLRDAGPIPDTQSLVATIGESGRRLLDISGWVAGYQASYADTPRLPAGANPSSYVGLSITLLRFSDDAAATRVASALEVANWADFGNTVAAPLPRHSEVGARYTPGTGVLRLDASIGPFVLRLRLEAPPDGIEKRIGELDAAFDEEQALLGHFTPTPVAEIASLPMDPDGLLARMVATDPSASPHPSATFAVYGPTGALRDQTRAIRADKLYQKWGVDQFAVSGSQRLYKLRDSQAAHDMAAEVIASSVDVEQEIVGDPNVPNTRCFHAEATAANLSEYTCRMWFHDVFTVIRADSAQNVREMAAAQYVLLATR
jgi:hypothetical protein